LPWLLALAFVIRAVLQLDQVAFVVPILGRHKVVLPICLP